MFEPPKLHFLHIPKTAGTSIIQFLQRQYNLDQIVFETTWRELFKYDWPGRRLPKLRLFRGHFGINLKKMIGPEFKVMTFLRDPVARVISQYRYQRVTPTEGLYKIASVMNLDEFIHHPQGRKLCRNLQTRYLGQDLEIGQIWAREISLNLPPDQSFDQLAAPELLESAKRNLKEFFFVGITEYFDLSMLLLCYKFKALPELDAVRRRAQENGRDLPSIETIEYLREENRLDLELYEFGKFILAQDIAHTFNMPELLTMPADEALSCADQNKEDLLKVCLSRYAERMLQDRQRSWHWDATKALQGTGWWDVHGYPDEVPHRWSGPKTISTIDAPVDPSQDYVLTIQVMQFMTPHIQRGLEVYAGENKLPLKVKKSLEGWELFGVVTGRKQNEPFLRLTFSVPETVSMAELGLDPQDNDKRGFALRSVSLVPAQS